MDSPLPLYQRLAAHYQEAVAHGTLQVGERFPSLRTLMRRHDVSLSTAVQVCRQLEQEGWLEARPRSGNFVRRPARPARPVPAEPRAGELPDPAQFVGIHSRVSEIIARGRQQPVRVNFSSARSAPELYPGEALRQASARALRRYPDLLVSPPPANGCPDFLQVLAQRALESGMNLRAEDIVVTQGCIEALNLALRAVARPGDTVAVESPTFYGLLQLLETLGLKALEIPTSPQSGLSLEALELACEHYGPIAALVVVPHMQNPLGCSMPDARKEALVALCAARGIPLIEDDTYSALREQEAPLLALKHWDREGGVIHCASLHKVLAPGLRLGWISAGRWQARVEMLKYAQSRQNEALSQLAAADFMGTGAFDRHLRRLRAALTRQRQRMAEGVAEYFPPGTLATRPQGGLAMWIQLPPGVSSQAVFDRALGEGIFIAPGLMFSNSNRFDGYFRLNCGMPYTPPIDAALRRLGEIVGELSPMPQAAAA